MGKLGGVTMNNKKRITIIAVLTMLFTLLSVALASDYDYDFYSNTEIATEDVARVMDEIIAREGNLSMVDEDEASLVVASYDLSRSYIYETVVYNMLTAYNENKDFNDILTGAKYVNVLCTTVSGSSAFYDVVKAIDGTVSEGGAAFKPDVKPTDKEVESYQYFAPETLERIINENFEDIPETIKILYSRQYYMTMVYVVADGVEYIIPRYNLVYAPYGELKDDTVYKLDYFFEEMNRVIEETNEPTDEVGASIDFKDDYLEGIYREKYPERYESEDKKDLVTEKTNYVGYIIAIGVGLVAIASVIMVKVKKSR